VDENNFCIAILDEEQKERDDFENYFEENGFICLTLHDISTIDELINAIRSEKIDAVAIDYKLMDHNSSFEHNGDYFLKGIQESLLDYPAFILTNDPHDAKKNHSKINPFYILHKIEMDLTNSSLADDVSTIIQGYKAAIVENTLKLEDLEGKRNRKGLTPAEEELYVELNNKLDKTIDQRSLIPRSFYSIETNSKLDEIIKKTEELLNKVS